MASAILIAAVTTFGIVPIQYIVLDFEQVFYRL